MNAARVLAQAEAAGIRFRIEDGAVRMEADAPPPADLLAELRQHREEILALLDHDRAEAEAVADSYAVPAADPGDYPDWYRPQGLDGPDRLAEGLLKGFFAHR
jgi:hypothetical protein